MLVKTDIYTKQAEEFLKNTGTTIAIKFKEHGKHFPNDKDSRDIYTVTLAKDGRSYTFNFGQSIVKSGVEKPTAYDILSCLSADCPDDFNDFCNEYGCDNDSRQAEATFKAVRTESENLERLYNNDELILLGEIC